MNTILFNNSLGVEKRQTLLCLLICSNAVIFRAEPSVGTGNIFLLDQHFLILGHGSITAVLKCSLVESFAAELILVRLSIIATIGLAQRHNISVHRNSSLKRPGSLLSCFLCFSQHVRGKKLPLESAIKLSLQSSLRRNSHTSFLFSLMQS